MKIRIPFPFQSAGVQVTLKKNYEEVCSQFLILDYEVKKKKL